MVNRISDLVFGPSCHGNLFYFGRPIEQKMLLVKPITISLSEVVLDTHIKSCEFSQMTWLNLSS